MKRWIAMILAAEVLCSGCSVNSRTKLSPISNGIEKDSPASIIEDINEGTTTKHPLDTELLTMQAEALTDHLLKGLGQPLLDNDATQMTNKDIYRFMIYLLLYTDNTSHPYYNFVLVDDEGYAIFPLDKMQQIVYELFGESNWFVDNTDFDIQAQCYKLMTGFGLEGGYFCHDLTTTVDTENSLIQTKFTLTSDPSFPEVRNLGNYQIIYDIVLEEQHAFLRYKKLEQLG